MKGEMLRAITTVAQDLGLPTGDLYTQDWVYELPEEFRDEAHFSKYLAAYETPGYGDSERRLIMQLLLDLTEDFLQRDEPRGREAWEKVLALLRAEPELHRDQVEYWALPEQPLEQAFRLTPLARQFIERQ